MDHPFSKSVALGMIARSLLMVLQILGKDTLKFLPVIGENFSRCAKAAEHVPEGGSCMLRGLL
jgi:hypothetical protein